MLPLRILDLRHCNQIEGKAMGLDCSVAVFMGGILAFGAGDLSILRNMSNLSILYLDGCHEIEGRCLSIKAAALRVETLPLENLPGDTEVLAKNCLKLSELNLRECQKVTGESVPYLFMLGGGKISTLVLSPL